MKIRKVFVLLSAAVFLGVPLAAGELFADRDEVLPPADNPAYQEECSSCHFLYLPGLLPAGSWERIMRGTGDHFGEDLGLEDEGIREIEEYLVANSAERSGSKLSRKILKKLKGKTPLRITEVDYIKKEHRKIKPKVFEREAVGSFSNCGACHRTADKGDFEEDNIKIPK